MMGLFCIRRLRFDYGWRHGNFFCETMNGRLPLEHGSDRRETLAKRVSDDLQLFIFRRRKTFFGICFSGSMFFSKKWRFGGPVNF